MIRWSTKNSFEMSGNRLFVDTNIILYFFKGETEVVDLIADKDLLVSVISEIELLSFPKLTSGEEEKVKEFMENCTVIDLKPEVKQLTIEFRKKYRLKLPDAVIVASAFFEKLLY